MKSLITNSTLRLRTMRVISSTASPMRVPVPCGFNASSSRTMRSTWRVPLRGGTKRSTRSVKASRPTLSPLRMALKAMVAAISATISRLNWLCVPKSRLPDRSTASITHSSRSSRNIFTCGLPARALTFQSMVRTSSPTT